MTGMRAVFALGAAVGLLVAVARSGPAVQPLPTPAAADSGMYALAAGADGRTYLSWLEPVPAGGHAFKFARLERDGWGDARTIATGANWFVNWADHPSVAAAPDGRLFAHWLVNTGRKSGSYGYAIHARTSADAGATWTPIFDEGVKNVSDYSGFLAFLPGGPETLAVYLTPLHPDDGSSGHDEGGHIKTVGIARFGATGAEIDRAIVDPDACSCCSTDVAWTAEGPVAVYRDHQAGEIRDISIVRRVKGQWTAPAPVHRDGWTINACPTNGPAIAAAGRRVAVAWFTAADDRPRVHAAFSTDAGVTFSAPVRVDDGTPVGWPDVVMLDDGRTMVGWLERTANGVGEVRVREVSASGPSAAQTVAVTVSGRGAGIPMMVRQGRDLLVAWREGGVKTARVAVPATATAWR